MDLIHDYLTNGTALAALLSIIFLYSLFLYNRSSKGSKSKEAPIVAGAWPILGHLPLLKGSKTPHRTLGDLADKYGPLFTIKLGSKNALVLSNSEMAKECFTKFDAAISTRPKLVATEHLAYNGAMLILSPYGPYWRQVRKIALSEILANRRIEKLQEICVLEVETSIKELFNVWKSNNESNYVLVELKQWFIELNFNIVLPMLVGKRYFGAMNELDEEEAQKCIKAVEEILRLMGQFTVGDAIPCLERFDFGGHVKAMKKTSKELDKILDEWLKERRCNRTLNEKADRDQDFMDVLLSLFDGTTIEGFDADTTIKATMLSLIAGGIDTSAITLTWAMCLLLKNPHTLEKAKAELESHVGRDKCVTKSDINKLVYLQAIIKETLRLYPVGPLSAPREFTENCNVGGYDVKKGTRLILNLWKIQTDHNVWSDPLEFKPERFLNTHKDVDVRGRHFELLPFGCGRRICPGISFGLEMMHLILANFLHSFEILYSSGEPIDMTEVFGLTVSKATPLEILVKPCLSINCYETM